MDRLFADAIQELLEYESELKKELKYEEPNYKQILNSVYGICNEK